MNRSQRLLGAILVLSLLWTTEGNSEAKPASAGDPDARVESPRAQRGPESTPQASFARLLDALRRCDEEAVWRHVTSGSRALVDRGLQGALERDRSALEGLSAAERTLILAVRLRAEGQPERARRARNLLCQPGQPAFEPKRFGLGPSFGTETSRTSPLLIDGRAAGLPVHMVLQEGAWRLDLERSSMLLDGAIGVATMLGGVSEDAAILALLESLAGRPIDDSVWLPLELDASSTTPRP